MIKKIKIILSKLKHQIKNIFLPPIPPKFLIIGAQKAGTVAMIKTLNNTSYFSGPFKELGYFTKKSLYSKGKNYYHNQFKGLDPNTIIFDKDPTYLYSKDAPKRIYDYNKNMKFLVMLRHPIERAYSGWAHYKKYFEETNGYSKKLLLKRANIYNELTDPYFEKLLGGRPYDTFEYMANQDLMQISNGGDAFNVMGIIHRSVYLWQINRYLKYFDKDQFLFVFSDDFKSNAQNEMDRLSEFIGLNDTKINVINQISHSGHYASTQIDKKLNNKLKAFFKPHNEALFELIGQRNEHW